MFCGSLAEKSGTIKIPDIEPKAFQKFLRFIYTEDCQVDEGSVMSVLYSSKKYETKRLTDKCMEYLNEQLSIDNVFVILQHAHNFDEEQLAKKCLEFILEHGNDVLKSDGIVSVSKEILKSIVDSDELNAIELNVYDACKRWALQQCKMKEDKSEYSDTELREQMGDLVYSIKFPTMSVEEFANQVSTNEILTPDEKVSIFQSISGVSTEEHKHKFSKERRQPWSMYSKGHRVNVHRYDRDNMVTGWGHFGRTDVIDFKVSRQTKFLGVRLFSPCYYGSLQGQVSLQFGDKTLASRDDFRIAYGESKYTEEVLFDKPVIVEAGEQYTVYTKLKGSNTYYCEDGRKEVSCESLVVTFFNNAKSTNSTDVHRGQIPSLIFEI